MTDFTVRNFHTGSYGLRKTKYIHTLPEREKDDGLYSEELPYWVIRTEDNYIYTYPARTRERWQTLQWGTSILGRTDWGELNIYIPCQNERKMTDFTVRNFHTGSYGLRSSYMYTYPARTRERWRTLQWGTSILGHTDWGELNIYIPCQNERKMTDFTVRNFHTGSYGLRSSLVAK